jgi:hypothetical protein
MATPNPHFATSHVTKDSGLENCGSEAKMWSWFTSIAEQITLGGGGVERPAVFANPT